MPAIERLTAIGARFVNGVEEEFDVIIMATGYASTVSKWLKVHKLLKIANLQIVSNDLAWICENFLFRIDQNANGCICICAQFL